MRLSRSIAIILGLFVLGAAAQTVSLVESRFDASGTLTDPKEIAPGKRMLLRSFYSDKQLTYGERGTPLGAHVGTWLGDGYVEIEVVKNEPEQVEVLAKRLRGYFEKSQRLRFKDSKETVVIRIPKTLAMDSVFLRRDENLLPMLSPIWGKFLSGTSAYPDRANVFKPDGPTRPPKPYYNPEPSWPDHKDKAEYQGSVTIVCVVDERGFVSDVEVAKPVGAGLDEKAAEAAAGWRFEPASRKKQPVAVRIQIDVDFHLY